jgi:hypothetical protein
MSELLQAADGLHQQLVELLAALTLRLVDLERFNARADAEAAGLTADGSS